MALWLRDLSLEVTECETLLLQKAASVLGIDAASLRDFKIIKRSFDARKKNKVRRVFTVEFSADNEEELVRKQQLPNLQRAPRPVSLNLPRVPRNRRVLVVGMGPSGLFAAKLLAEAGVSVTLIERGRPIEKRVRDVERFWATGSLDLSSNVQFGEGGAGTFSDGKLTTRLKNPWQKYVLKTFVDFGASDAILVDAKPHIGTDHLRKILINFRRCLLKLGVILKYETCLTDLKINRNRVVGGILNNSDYMDCDSLVLAPGHSARDTYLMLYSRKIQLQAKSFAIGVRVEHPAQLINKIQYGKADLRRLPTADYSLRYNDLKTGRGIYSFCMCPGGEVINASSEAAGLVVNGMSYANRNSEYSNSALVVSVRPGDWGDDVIRGIDFQRRWEQAAFRAAGSNYFAPAQNLMNFLGRGHGPINTLFRPGVVEVDMRQVLPEFVSQALFAALPHFDRQMSGFLTREAVLIGVETRTSSPLRIVRNAIGESNSHKGLFPAGEGSGYAGGIMSAALDGMRVAQQVLQTFVTGGRFEKDLCKSNQ